jgi:hypothetical protein
VHDYASRTVRIDCGVVIGSAMAQGLVGRRRREQRSLVPGAQG